MSFLFLNLINMRNLKEKQKSNNLKNALKKEIKKKHMIRILISTFLILYGISSICVFAILGFSYVQFDFTSLSGFLFVFVFSSLPILSIYYGIKDLLLIIGHCKKQ